MMDEKEKTTAPGSLVGASGGQSNAEHENSIPDCIREINEEDEISLENLSMEELEAVYQKAVRLSDPSYLPTITMNELYENVYASPCCIMRLKSCTGAASGKENFWH